LVIVVLVAGFLVAIFISGGVDREVEGEAEDLIGYGGPHSDDNAGGRTLFHTGVPIGGRKNGESYGEFNRRRSQSAISDYAGFGCIGDCRVNEAGYRWAASKRLNKPKQCVGSTWQFVEGCAAYTMPEKRRTGL
jgi:hypothetical protein